jgi:hypothetical protein
MEPGELYWTLAEPHWERVSIYNGGEVFLREYALTCWRAAATCRSRADRVEVSARAETGSVGAR